jgi:DNA-binding transcriptional ArsR family regulator
MSAEEGVWKALSNPVRRVILDLLREGPRTTGELAQGFEGLSRFAVMQHLEVLVEAGVVLVRREGRQRFNHLNAVPIQEIHERWVSRFAERDASAMLALRRHVEGGPKMSEQTGRMIRLEAEIRLKASPERVFKAWTQEQRDWYPYTYGGDKVRSIVLEPRVGGSCYEDWGDGAGHLYSTVTHYDPPNVIITRGWLQPAIILEQSAQFLVEGDETVVKTSTVTFGPISDEMAEGIRTHGDMTLFEDKLRAWVERGERVGA